MRHPCHISCNLWVCDLGVDLRAEIEACPIILAMLSIGIPAPKASVPKLCLATW